MKKWLPELPVGCTDEQLEGAYGQGLLRKSELKHGTYYRGTCRGGDIARWHAGGQAFLQYQNDCGFRILRAIPHPQDERQWDAFMVVEVAEQDEINEIKPVGDDEFETFFENRPHNG